MKRVIVLIIVIAMLFSVFTPALAEKKDPLDGCQPVYEFPQRKYDHPAYAYMASSGQTLCGIVVVVETRQKMDLPLRARPVYKSRAKTYVIPSGREFRSPYFMIGWMSIGGFSSNHVGIYFTNTTIKSAVVYGKWNTR